MPVRIFNNIASLNAQRILGVNNDRLSQSVERIASGIRINRGADDAAGLAISESLRSDIRALRQAIRNSNDGINLINVVEGALNEQSGILIRLRELASQAATGTVGSAQRATIQLEFKALQDELDRIADTTEFNGQKLIDGSLSINKTTSQLIVIQVGIDASKQSQLNLNNTINLPAIKTNQMFAELTNGTLTIAKDDNANETNMALKLTFDTKTNILAANPPPTGFTAGSSGPLTFQGVPAGAGTGAKNGSGQFISLAQLKITNPGKALVTLEAIDKFIAIVTDARGKVGAVQNRLVRTIANLNITVENLQSAESAIRDADIASEVAFLTRNQILVQASTAMVGQANLIPQSVLQLLQ